MTMNGCKLEWLVNQWLALTSASMEQGKLPLFLEKRIDHLFIQAPILVFRNEVCTDGMCRSRHLQRQVC